MRRLAFCCVPRCGMACLLFPEDRSMTRNVLDYILKYDSFAIVNYSSSIGYKKLTRRSWLLWRGDVPELIWLKSWRRLVLRSRLSTRRNIRENISRQRASLTSRL
ncbi:hypothetical protein PUN4_510097 [Paraburkholderia unamae]|nr:hypothetical protein PUN4_510097 [Paraburkholderia unamae]